MPIQFRCPHCQTQTIVDDRYAGQSGPCVECGKIITVPVFATATASATPLPAKPARRTLLPVLAVVVGTILAGAVGIGVLLAIVFPAIQRIQAGEQRKRSAENLRKIGMALRTYEAEYGCFPPPYVAGPDGKPMHSWRVLLLPYLGHEGLYRDYDFSQPWDSPANMMLVSRMPAVFSSPGDQGAQSFGETNYMVIVGPNTVFPPHGTTRSSDIKDGPGQTIMVAETNIKGIVWIQPVDLNVKSMNFSINGKGDSIGGSHSDGANVLMADEQTRFLRNDTPSDFVEGLTTRNGGEIVPLDDYDY